MQGLSSISQRFQHGPLVGPVITAAAIVGVEFLSRSVLDIRSITGLIAVVGYVAYLGGLRAGLISAAIASLYGVYYFSIPGQPLRYAGDNALRVVILPLTAGIVAVFVGTLRNNVRASQARIQHELHFRQAIDRSLGEGVYALDHQGRVTYMNPTAEQLLGWTESALRGQIMHDMIHYQHPDGTPFPREQCTGLVEVMRSRQTFRTDDDVFIRKDGSMFPVAYSSSPILVDDNVLGVVVAFRDMTARKQAEQALRDSEFKLQLITQQLPAHLWITDRDLCITEVHGSYVGTTVRQPSYYIGKSLRELITPDQSTYALVIAAHRQALQGEQATYELEALDRHFDVRVEPLRDAKGQIVGCIGLALNITPRKRAEHALHIRVRQQAAIADLGRRAISMMDVPTLMYESVTLVAATLDVEYCHIFELLPDGTTLMLRAGAGWDEQCIDSLTLAASVDSQLSYTLQAKAPTIATDLPHETRFTALPFQQERGIISSMSVIIHRQERPFGILGVDTVRQRGFIREDVYFLHAVANVLTAAIERKTVAEQLALEHAEAERLAELDRLRRDFMASVSHELRTPLTATHGGLGMLETSLATRLREDERRLMQNARRNIEHLRRLIDDLLTYHQLESGTLQLNVTSVDLRTIVDEVLPAVQPLLRDKGQAITIDLPEPLPTSGDARWLGQGVINLLMNAHQHTPDGSRIRVVGHMHDHVIVLSIADNGPGMLPGGRETIFQRFQQLGAGAGGAGLGLLISQGIIELHGGRLWIESAAGSGATVCIRLPGRSTTKEQHDA